MPAKFAINHFFLEADLKRHEQCHWTSISANQWDSESLNSSTDEEEREARRDLDDALARESIVLDDDEEDAPKRPKDKGIGKKSKR